MEKIIVLHIIKSLGRGGAEMLLPETLAKHDQNKFEFHYIYFLPWKNQVVGELEENKGLVTCIKAVNNFQIIMSAFKLKQYIRKHKISIIHAHLPWAGITARLAGKIAGVPVLYTEHNIWSRYHKLTYWLNRITFGLQDTVIAVSKDVKDSIQQHYKKSKPDVQVILNGVNTEKFDRKNVAGQMRQQLNIADKAIVIGIICVFRTQKRLDLWLKIAKELSGRNEHLFFLVIGDGPLKEEVLVEAKRLELTNIHFAGLQKDVRPYLQAMDVFMMTSKFEGLPIALLEAMSMECVPACTDAGGIPEVIGKDGSNGILVPVDSAEQLTDEIVGLLEKGMDNVKANARLRIQESFSIEVMVAQLENLYTLKAKR